MKNLEISIVIRSYGTWPKKGLTTVFQHSRVQPAILAMTHLQPCGKLYQFHDFYPKLIRYSITHLRQFHCYDMTTQTSDIKILMTVC